MKLVSLLIVIVNLTLWTQWTSAVEPSLGLLRKSPGKLAKPSGYGERPRGVAFNNAPLYATGANFTCFSGTKMIPSTWVNDDYCDCPDGSDEPGTSACATSKFHCLNRGYKAADIPSSRVNDQICDCCDGSDEWDSAVDCPNVCEEVGAKWRQELQKKKETAEKGYIKRADLAKEGTAIKAEKEKGIEELRKQRDELVPKRDEADAKRKEIETRETEAKNKHEKAWQEELDRRKEAKQVALFTALDVDSDGKITIVEMKTFKEFDSDNNGEVSDDEAKEYLSNADSSDLEHFKSNVYDQIKMLFPDGGTEDKEEDEMKKDDTEELFEHLRKDDGKPILDEGDEKNEEIMDEGVEEALKEAEDEAAATDATTPEPATFDSLRPPRPKRPVDEDEMPPYDEETQKLIAEADEARKAYREIDDQIRNLDSSISESESYISGDFGEDLAWVPLKGKWFELDDGQYIYKVSLFDRAVQKEKSGHMEISLGHWNSWSSKGEEGTNTYTEQLYDRGQGCWNGPERSTRVVIECGEETALVEATEPSKCEYRFVLKTPAGCPNPATIDDLHDEL